MFQDELLNRVAKNAPVTVMARGMLENILSPAKLDGIFQHHVRTQRQRTILFSFHHEGKLQRPIMQKRLKIVASVAGWKT